MIVFDVFFCDFLCACFGCFLFGCLYVYIVVVFVDICVVVRIIVICISLGIQYFTKNIFSLLFYNDNMASPTTFFSSNLLCKA